MNGFQEHRRKLLRSAAGLALGGAAMRANAQAKPQARLTSQEWDALASEYEVASEFANLENGYYGIMARPVAEEFKRNIDYLNRYNSWHLRRHFDREDIETIRAELASHAGASKSEIAITRSATESLQNLISNYRLLRPGDAVMLGNLDYDIMIDAMHAKAAREGASVAKVEVPEPPTRQNVIDAYERALRAHPRTRLLLLTHISHRTGLVLPVAEIVRIAKARKVDVIVDVAHSWGQLDYRIPDFGADFVGANLHKWVGAPLGLGFLYIRDGRLQDIAPERGSTLFPTDDIRSRVHSGTVNFAAVMTIPAALRFHARIPLAERSARLRSLRDYWVERVLGEPQVQILTPQDPAMYGAVTSFRLKGQASFEANVALSRRLADEFGVFTVARSGPAGGSCIRVTPAYFTRTADLDLLVTAIRAVART